MSAYVQLSTPMTQVDCLLDALADLGFNRDSVAVHATAVAVGNMANGQPALAHIVINSPASGRFGFLKSPTGLQLVGTGATLRTLSRRWMKDLSERYEYHAAERQRRLSEEQRRAAEEERRRLVEATRSAVIEKAKNSGYRIEERVEQGCVRLVLSKRVY